MVTRKKAMPATMPVIETAEEDTGPVHTLPPVIDSGFNYTKADSNKERPDPLLIGQTFTHSTQKKNFMVTGFAWDASTDQWNMVMMERNIGSPTPVMYPLAALDGKTEAGAKRFTRVF